MQIELIDGKWARRGLAFAKRVDDLPYIVPLFVSSGKLTGPLGKSKVTWGWTRETRELTVANGKTLI